MLMVPRGALNLHGHLHGGREPTRRHLNLAVEQTDYRPVRMNGHRREGPAPAVRRPASAGNSGRAGRHDTAHPGIAGVSPTPARRCFAVCALVAHASSDGLAFAIAVVALLRTVRRGAAVADSRRIRDEGEEP